MHQRPLKTFARKTLAGFMAVWLSGFLFLLCCAVVPGGPIDAVSNSLDSMSEHCKKAMAARSAKVSGDVFELSGTDSFACCGFLPTVFDKNRKIDRIDQLEIVSSQRLSVRFDVTHIAVRPSTTVRARPFIPDRQYSFIKNQVFRI